MNETAYTLKVAPDVKQVIRLKDLITEMVKCCEDRRLYEFDRFGLPYAEVRCLMLFPGERYLTAKDIAQRMDVAKSRVTKIILGLEDKGLVQRVADPADARVTLIRLTKDGQRKVDEIDSFHRDLHTKILMQFSEDDRTRLLAHMERLRGAMQVVKETLK